MNKLLIIGVCLLFFSFIPSVHSITPHDGNDTPLMLMAVFGLFPRVYNDTVTFFALPVFHWVSLPLDNFKGYIGIFILYGCYDPNPYI